MTYSQVTNVNNIVSFLQVSNKQRIAVEIKSFNEQLNTLNKLTN